ncbi:4Fe-4S dicluster domain-containing protein [Dactylosporangium sucinum]|uniref:4Fe-4S ferredoxin n=1 Tax=Dactylosporangium sucinum TaxID=1424081 RepID=A0A917UB67_9ACTN|nr:4Fe-4S dicluster domain-containing protein [Dactylosporangium sucinum]GGM68187.1 4Fe-4S ferredoxin [Dactylosporangium sucinum]
MEARVMLAGLDGLFEALHADGRTIVGPTVRAGAVVLTELTDAAELPYGWRTEVEAGTYRLRPGDEGLAFTHTSGPHSWKQVLHPPRERLLSADRGPDGFTVTEQPVARRSLALFGVRPCDLRAIGVLDHVLGDGTRYADRRADVLTVVVNCTEPGAACFCVSAGGRPGADDGYDIALTERPGGHYLAAAGTPRGASVLDRVPATPASGADVEQAAEAVEAAAERMGRTVPETDLRALLAGNLEHPRWDDVAARCLTCGNCTMVCPTCFCTSVTDTTDLTGDHAERWETWESCFDLDFSHLHDGPVRGSGHARYRQWLTHKFGTWHDQFGESGCVGCGRCIVWCPVGIDVTEELHALAAGDQP